MLLLSSLDSRSYIQVFWVWLSWVECRSLVRTSDIESSSESVDDELELASGAGAGPDMLMEVCGHWVLP